MAYTYPEYRAFYVSKLGQRVVTSLGRRIGEMWPDVTGRHALVLGYAEPWMDVLAKDAASVVIGYPARMGAAPWPGHGNNKSCMIDPLDLPLPDSSFDVVFVSHVLEHVLDPATFLCEVWRVLSPGGQLVMMVPNRLSMWSRYPHTPFDGGQPYSCRQLTHQLEKRSFTVAGTEWAVHFPPLDTPVLSKVMGAIEGATAKLYPRFGGALLMLAEKRMLETRTKKPSQVRLYTRQPVAVPKTSL